jgi:uncharacterized paraquat-inducible protein A
MKLKASISIVGWKYAVEINQETGDLIVLSHEKVGLVEKAAQYAKAEASRVLQGPVSLEVIGQRKAACDGCEGCDKRAEGEWYCNRCGCPKWKRSQLQVKWEMPAATCPLGKWPQVG